MDVDTPNSSNNSICSIGIYDMKMVRANGVKNILVNQEAQLDNMNIEIQVITPKMIENHRHLQKFCTKSQSTSLM